MQSLSQLKSLKGNKNAGIDVFTAIFCPQIQNRYGRTAHIRTTDRGCKMKLVTILARELEEWPEGDSVKSMSQDDDSLVSKYTGGLQEFSCGSWGNVGRGYIPSSRFKVGALASDFKTAIITRAEWKAERKRIAEPAEKADKDGWIRHLGGNCPVDAGVLVDVKYRDGQINEHVKALTPVGADGSLDGFAAVDWFHTGHDYNIMQYRLHKPAEQPAQAFCALEARDRIREIDTTAQALQVERAALVDKLASEGLALITGAQPVEDMSNPANWRKGDVITFVRSEGNSCFTPGKQYDFDDIYGYGLAGVLDDDEGEENSCDASYFKWHSRPSA